MTAADVAARDGAESAEIDVADQIFTREQVAALTKGLQDKRIKTRTQAGVVLRYLESHDVIDVANAIFGYGNWSQDVRSIELIKTPSCAFYQAVVAIRVYSPDGKRWVERVDVGDSTVDVRRGEPLDSAKADHYSKAYKGAISDAGKRALRTFGDQFGLSLYGKDDHGGGWDSASGGWGAPEGPVSQAATQPRTAAPAGAAQTPAAPAPGLAKTKPCTKCGDQAVYRSGTNIAGKAYQMYKCTKCGNPEWIN